MVRAWFIYLDLRMARGWFISLQPCLLSCETFFMACFVKNCEIGMLGDWLRKLKVFASHSAKTEQWLKRALISRKKNRSSIFGSHMTSMQLELE